MLQTLVLFLLMLISITVNAMETELKFYHPWAESIKHPSVTVTEQKSGECWQQSHIIKREDAWRCKAEGKIYDPCFIPPFSHDEPAICPQSPWSSSGIQINLSSPANASQQEALDMSTTFPWAVELTNGEKCQAVNEDKLYDGLPVRYHCDRNTELFGHVQRCNNPWKILQHGADGVSTAQIARAWF